MKYFAYGSNMCTKRIQRRVPSAQAVAIGKLNGYQLKWHKVSNDGSGKCNAFETGNIQDEIIGVLFDFNDNEKNNLDEAEKGYNDKAIDITTSAGIVSAYLYVADVNRIDNSLIPYSWYKELVVNGAEQHNLPEDYIEKLRSVVSITDTGQSRATRNQNDFPC